MNMSNVSHAFLALVAQAVIYFITKNLWIGAAFGSAFYFGREVAQHESDQVKRYGKRAGWFDDEGMPWYEGFKFLNWSTDSKYDLIFPVVAVYVVALLEHFA